MSVPPLQAPSITTPSTPEEVFAFYQTERIRGIVQQCLSATESLQDRPHPAYLSRKNHNLPRSILYFPAPKRRFVLMTQTKEERDLPIAITPYKEVQIAIDQNQRIWAVVTRILKNDRPNRSMPEELFERLRGCKRILLPHHQIKKTIPDGHKRYDIEPYCNRGDLLMARTNPALTPKKKIAIFRQILEAVKELHDRGVVHRDIKLDNIFLQEEDIYVADLDHAIDASLLHLEPCWRGAGTSMYLPPETKALYAQGQDPFKLDTWALGCTLFAWIANCGPVSFFEPSMELKPNIPACFDAIDHYLECHTHPSLRFLIPIVQAFLHRDLNQRISVETALSSINWEARTVNTDAWSRPPSSSSSSSASPAAGSAASCSAGSPENLEPLLPTSSSSKKRRTSGGAVDTGISASLPSRPERTLSNASTEEEV